MDLTTLATIAEIAAGFGVIVSLLILAWQMRKTGQQTALSNQQNVIAGLREARDWMRDPETARIIVAGQEDFEALDKVERAVFNNWAMNAINAMHTAILHGNSMVHKGAPAARNNLHHMFTAPGVRNWWGWSGLAARWPADLVAEVEAAIAAGRARAQQADP